MKTKYPMSSSTPSVNHALRYAFVVKMMNLYQSKYLKDKPFLWRDDLEEVLVLAYLLPP